MEPPSRIRRNVSYLRFEKIFFLVKHVKNAPDWQVYNKRRFLTCPDTWQRCLVRISKRNFLSNFHVYLVLRGRCQLQSSLTYSPRSVRRSCHLEDGWFQLLQFFPLVVLSLQNFFLTFQIFRTKKILRGACRAIGRMFLSISCFLFASSSILDQGKPEMPNWTGRRSSLKFLSLRLGRWERSFCGCDEMCVFFFKGPPVCATHLCSLFSC